MKCISCQLEIDPKWRHAIEKNICPFCGESILNPILKELLSSLFDTMTKLQEFPEELNDWMFSNFNYIKTDAENLIDFVPPELLQSKPRSQSEKKTIKVKTDKGEEDIESQQVLSEQETNEFFKLSGALQKKDGFSSIAEKTQHYKNLAEKAKKGEASLLIDSEMIEDEPKEVEIKSALSPMIAPPLEDELPNNNILNALMKIKSKKQSSQKNELEKLQEMQKRREDSQNVFESGGGGAFHRG